MAYTYENCLKDLEKLLNRPINSFEFQYVNTWFDNYPNDFLNACLEMCKGRVIYKVSYISSILYQHYPFYQAYMKVNVSNLLIPKDLDDKTKEEYLKPKPNQVIVETEELKPSIENKEVLDKFMALLDDE